MDPRVPILRNPSMRLRRCTPVLVVALALLLAGCGFHLRRSAALPAGMQTVHLDIAGGGSLQRQLTRALQLSGATVVEHAGTGVATLRAPVAQFSTNALTLTGFARVSEYSVSYHVEFEVLGADGHVIAPMQRIDLAHEFTFDSTQAIGIAGEVDAIQRSLTGDMVQAILRRLDAIARHPPPQPAPG